MDICKILEESKNIAVVGISRNPFRMSRMIADFLVRNGYNVVGVNPGKPKIDGITVYANLKDIPLDTFNLIYHFFFIKYFIGIFSIFLNFP